MSIKDFKQFLSLDSLPVTCSDASSSCLKNFYSAKYLRIALFALVVAVRCVHPGHRVQTPVRHSRTLEGIPVFVSLSQLIRLPTFLRAQWDALLKYVGFFPSPCD